ncbi:hypothetical protein JGH11_09695 [Dysgonomonas sp. Marseille-P4677]|uniref:hypothetical protein n=1 Tax=Dysgonomonas sp. Marseille-P4677 TaxID=2364790 RepID=UPI001913580E|nr:hypothetical protein [Dysgonomonas sp. Marseille-P4677]MBK5721140.1 hypothetical protein [Dysgonomonas sp. Marseille-P4677]
MKNIYKLSFIFTSIILLLSSCSPDDPTLGNKLSQNDLRFDVKLNPQNSNQIILTSDNTQNTVYWSWDNEVKSATGHSTKHSETLSFGFAGDYTFYYSVVSPGGLTTSEAKVVNIPTYDLKYMDNILWTYLTGGPGKEKTWLLDLDKNGKSVYFTGPLYFYGTNDSWLSITEGQSVGGDSWNWNPDYPGNSWLMPAIDYGSITFGAITGHTLVANKVAEKVEQNGSYWFDVDNHTLTTAKATILRDVNRIPIVSKWEQMKVMSLTENSMQLGVLRDSDPNEGPCLLVYNFVSKDYYDSHK